MAFSQGPLLLIQLANLRPRNNTDFQRLVTPERWGTAQKGADAGHDLDAAVSCPHLLVCSECDQATSVEFLSEEIGPLPPRAGGLWAWGRTQVKPGILGEPKCRRWGGEDGNRAWVYMFTG